jgi:hypothetical protein
VIATLCDRCGRRILHGGITLRVEVNGSELRAETFHLCGDGDGGTVGCARLVQGALREALRVKVSTS